MTTLATMPRLQPIGTELKGPKVVALGGGHGLAVTLRAARRYTTDITAIVAVADDGGSSGRLTTGLGLPPPGDVRRCLLALAPLDSIWGELFGYRFSAGDIEDHSLGNLLLAALTDLTGDFGLAVDYAGRILDIVGRVIPAATAPAVLRAIAGGREIQGQAAITKARDIESVSLGPETVSANPAAIEAIRRADQLVLGPGSLYTSLMAVLLVPGITEAWQGSAARKYFVLNLIDQEGETLGLTGEEHVRALAAIAGVGGPGTIICHEGRLEVPENHAKVSIRPEEAWMWGWDVTAAHLAAKESDWPEHDPSALAKVLGRSV